MAKPDLRKMMANRTPLSPRQAVEPANLYEASVSPASEPANQQADLLVSEQASEPAIVARPGLQQSDIARPPVADADLQARKQTSKPVKKFASYLRHDSIKALKMVALREDKNDYEVLQEAVDAYLERKGVRVGE
jgi:hypothetical protein